MVVNYFQLRPDSLVYLLKAGFTKERKRTVACGCELLSAKTGFLGVPYKGRIYQKKKKPDCG